MRMSRTVRSNLELCIFDIRDETFKKMNEYAKRTVTKLEGVWLKIFGESEDVFYERYETIYTHMTVSISIPNQP